MSEIIECPKCKGKGFKLDYICPSCVGAGKQEIEDLRAEGHGIVILNPQLSNCIIKENDFDKMFEKIKLAKDEFAKNCSKYSM